MRAASGPGWAGSSAIPHFGQIPDSPWRTSGCMGHVQSAGREERGMISSYAVVKVKAMP